MNVYYGNLGIYRNAVLIYNPYAGAVRRNPRLIESIEAELRAQGIPVTASPTDAAGHATELARHHISEGADLILVAGGDGTINEAVNGMVGTRVPLAVLPAGTANVFAVETGISRNISKAVRSLPDWKPTRIAIGLVRNTDGSPRKHFLSMAGAGFDAHVVLTVNQDYKRRLGKAAYWLAGFQSIPRSLEEFNIESRGNHTVCSFALMSRVRNYGGDLEIAARASLLRDQFDVVLFEGSNALRYLKYLGAVMIRRANGISGMTVLQTRHLALAPHNGKDVHLQVDGELCGQLPAIIELVPDALTVLLPPEFLANERSRWKT